MADKEDTEKTIAEDLVVTKYKMAGEIVNRKKIPPRNRANGYANADARRGRLFSPSRPYGMWRANAGLATMCQVNVTVFTARSHGPIQRTCCEPNAISPPFDGGPSSHRTHCQSRLLGHAARAFLARLVLVLLG